jgi:two-component system, OmpR family, response regulator ResD
MKLSKLLLVEDNQDAADLIIGLLDHAGHVIVHKTSGIEALQIAQAEYFDGMLLDYMLPDMEGLQLCRMIREFAPDVPIILTTAYVDKLTPEAMFEAGITGYVPKPLSQNLVQTIDKYVKDQSMAMVKQKEPSSWLKRMLGPFYVE